MMSRLFLTGILLLWLLNGPRLCAQTPPPPRAIPAPTDTTAPRRAINERPLRPKFIPEADQRFFFFRNPADVAYPPTNVWGVRAGVLFPSNLKIGIGYYFTTQKIPGIWQGYAIQKRRLEYLLLGAEPYLFRRAYWELSLPVEVGAGTAQYNLIRLTDQQSDIRRVFALPLGVGVSASAKFPAIRRLRALRWFGVNALAGYRYTLQPGNDAVPTTYNGFFYAISPTVFLDRLYDDVAHWHRNRNQRGH